MKMSIYKALSRLLSLCRSQAIDTDRLRVHTVMVDLEVTRCRTGS